MARVALTLAPAPGVRVIVDQLLRAGTSVGANLEEAKAASFDRQFLRSAEVSLREARETVYWLKICVALKLGNAGELAALQDEGEQIARIVGAIVVNKKANLAVRAVVFLLCCFYLAS